MPYTHPQINDLGDLVALTQAGAIGGNEDGGAKSVVVVVDPIAEVSVAVIV